MTCVSGVGLDATPGAADGDGQHDMLHAEPEGERCDGLALTLVIGWGAQSMRDMRKDEMEVGPRGSGEDGERDRVGPARAGEEDDGAGRARGEPSADGRENSVRTSAGWKRPDGHRETGVQRRVGALARPGRSTARQ